MAKSISNSTKKILGRKKIKTIYTLIISYFVIQGFKKIVLILLCFKEDNFIIVAVTSGVSPASVASFSIMEK